MSVEVLKTGLLQQAAEFKELLINKDRCREEHVHYILDPEGIHPFIKNSSRLFWYDLVAAND